MRVDELTADYWEHSQFLEKTKRKVRVEHLSREPMIFCQSDWLPDNFIIDSDGRITAIDFSDASILPSSFAKYML